MARDSQPKWMWFHKEQIWDQFLFILNTLYLIFIDACSLTEHFRKLILPELQLEVDKTMMITLIIDM